MLFVSHNMSAVTQLTDRAILLAGGQISRSGQSQGVVQLYLSEGRDRGIVEFDLRNTRRRYHGTGEARIVFLKFNRSKPRFEFNEPLSYCIGIKAERRISKIRASMTVHTKAGSPIIGSIGSEIKGLEPGEEREMIVALPPCRLSPGSYYCSVSIGRGDSFTSIVDYDIVTEILSFEVMPETNHFGALGEWHLGWGAICFESLSAAWAKRPETVSASGRD